MKKVLILLIVALALPAAALAKPPSTHTNHGHTNPNHGKSAPKVMYVLKGTLSNFAAATATTDGAISITVAHSNFHARALKGQTVTFPVAANTKITMRGTAAIPNGAKGIVKFKAPMRIALSGSQTLATMLPTMAKAFHVIVQKSPSTSPTTG